MRALPSAVSLMSGERSDSSAPQEDPVLAADSRGRLRAGGPQYRGATVLSSHPCTPLAICLLVCRHARPCRASAPCLHSRGRPPGRDERRPHQASTELGNSAQPVRAPQPAHPPVQIAPHHLPRAVLPSDSPFHHPRGTTMLREDECLGRTAVTALREVFAYTPARAPSQGQAIDSAPHGRGMRHVLTTGREPREQTRPDAVSGSQRGATTLVRCHAATGCGISARNEG